MWSSRRVGCQARDRSSRLRFEKRFNIWERGITAYLQAQFPAKFVSTFTSISFPNPNPVVPEPNQSMRTASPQYKTEN